MNENGTQRAINLVIGCSDKRLVSANQEFLKNLNPEITYFREGGLLYSIPNFSKTNAIKFFQNNLHNGEKVRIWALVHEDCEFMFKNKMFISRKWLKGEAKKANLLFSEVSKYCYISNNDAEVWYHKEINKIRGYKKESEKFDQIKEKYERIWQNNGYKLLEETAKILKNKINKLFSKPPLKELGINPELHIVYQLQKNNTWENYFSIIQFEAIQKLQKSTVLCSV